VLRQPQVEGAVVELAGGIHDRVPRADSRRRLVEVEHVLLLQPVVLVVQVMGR